VEDIDFSDISDGVIIIEAENESVADEIEEAFESEDFEYEGKVVEAEPINECDYEEIVDEDHE